MTTRVILAERETLARYEKRGALLRGHFRLTSGLHSDIYLQSALVLQHPEDAAALGAELATPSATTACRPSWPRRLAASWSPTRSLERWARERCSPSAKPAVMRLRRGFTLSPGERCLVVEDVVTTGGSTREVMQCVEESGGVVVGVGMLIDRSGGTATYPMKHAALATVAATTYPPDTCPLCKAGSHAIKPGSRS